jgi:hypothetical protein
MGKAEVPRELNPHARELAGSALVAVGKHVHEGV